MNISVHEEIKTNKVGLEITVSDVAESRKKRGKAQDKPKICLRRLMDKPQKIGTHPWVPNRAFAYVQRNLLFLPW